MTRKSLTGRSRNLHTDHLDWRYKGFPDSDSTTIHNLLDRQWNVLAGDLPTPVAVLIESRLAANLQTMAEYCRRHKVSIAPHGKTTMAPELIQRQLDSGAWAVTAASVAQVRVFREFGFPRIVLANEVVDRPSLRWIAHELERDPELELFCYVDSLDGVAIMVEVFNQCELSRPLPVLLEIGEIGGRAGCRSDEGVQEVADAVAGASSLELVGVAGFEGILASDRTPDSLQRVDHLIDRLRAVTNMLAETGSFVQGREVIVSAGGSAFFDRVVAVLGSGWPEVLSVRIVLRSGCYLTHDAGMYAELSLLSSTNDRSGLMPALEIWGRILSRPEPDLAIADFGRRDVSYDAGLPVPHTIVQRRGNVPIEVRDRLSVTGLNDQHAYVRVDTGTALGVGDLIGCGISHPCTTFDKWRVIPVVDDDYTVVGAVHTYF